MMRKQVHMIVAFLLSVTYVFGLCTPGFGAEPAVKLIVNPNKTDVMIGSDPIALTAKASGTNLKYKWSLQGPGAIEGEGSAVFYKLPEKIEGKSAQAVITVTITDDKGQQTTDAFTLNILAKEAAAEPAKKEEPKPAPTPAPEQKKGMSTGTKVAIGVGAAALVGGGIALLAGGDDEESDPFTGTFVGPTFSDTTNLGNTCTWNYTFSLQQNGNSITGTIVKNSTLVGCCSTVITVSVTGSVESDTRANLTWGAGSGRCECTQWIWNDSINANSGGVTLVNGGNTLRFDAGAEYNRSKLISKETGTEWEISTSPDGDFNRK